MTLNCPVNQQGIPLALPNQHFILYRHQVEFEVSVENLGKKKAKGIVHLTSLRIIFVAEKPDSQFYSFDIPILQLFNEKVQMPFFGNNYLKGSSTPYQNLLPGNSHFKLYFNGGNSHTFITTLSRIIQEVRRANQMHQSFENSQFYHDVRSGKFNFNAFVNPNDPSKLYTEQPKS